ncbi:MAG: sugar porter family MFS transporter [Cytophagales bacterium]|nr:sugar porter family MFS transporter [Cytophagales bacterium]
MKKFVFFNAIVAALGGFLFGFDTAVISGAEQDIQKLWGLSDLTHGLAVAIALYGTVIGSLVAGYPSEIIGRKKTLILVGFLYLISALGSALAPEVYSFMSFRFLGGLGVGVASVTAPMYISEISPAKFRGRLVALFQFNIVFGIMIAFVSNYFLEGTSENDWRWMLAVEAFPAFIYGVLVNFIPESPRWLLLHQNNEAGAKDILASMDPESVDESILAIKASVISVKEKLFSDKFSRPVILVFLFAFFNQMSGINAIIYFAPRIFNAAGLATDSSLLSTAGIGLINLVFTVLGMSVIDKAGRKTLMYIGSIGLMLSLLLISVYISRDFDEIYLFFFIYIAFFAMSQGAVIWVFISEIFPNTVRAYGQSFGSFTHWMFAAIIANVFPYFANLFINDQGPIFGFFGVMMFLQLIFVWKLMPETKGLSLERIQKRLGIE